MNPQNEREHENTPAAELVEQLIHLAVESCFHPSNEATLRLISLRVELARRLSVYDLRHAEGRAYSVPAPFIGDANTQPDPIPATAFGDHTEGSVPSPAEVKATVFPDEPAPEEPKQAKAKKGKS